MRLFKTSALLFTLAFAACDPAAEATYVSEEAPKSVTKETSYDEFELRIAYSHRTTTATLAWSAAPMTDFVRYEIRKRSAEGVTLDDELVATIEDAATLTQQVKFPGPPQYEYYRVYAYGATGHVESNEATYQGLRRWKATYKAPDWYVGGYWSDVAAVSTGEFFVNDNAAGKLLKFNAAGNFVTFTTHPDMSNAWMLATGPGDILYLGEFDHDKILKFDAALTYLGAVTAPAPGDPLLLANGDIVVPEDGGAINRYDSAGNLLDVIGAVGSGDGELSQPWGVYASPDGTKLYVLDVSNGRVQAFDMGGNYLFQFANYVESDVTTCQDCWGLNVDANGVVYVVNWTDGMNLYSGEGAFLGHVSMDWVSNGTNDSLWGIDFLPNGEMLVIGANSFEVYHLGQ